MLIEFSVANFLSIKERQTLRMDAASISDYPERVIDAGRYKLLRTAAIYGANASGKSNVLKAMGTMRYILATSAAQASTMQIPVVPFMLDTNTEHKPSLFEIIFLRDNIRYRYGFEVDNKTVIAEWLFTQQKLKEKLLFVREKNTIEVNRDFKEGKGLEEKTRDNALFLAVCDQFNGPVSGLVLKWFSQLSTISGNEHKNYREDLAPILNDPVHNTQILKFLGGLDLGFDEIQFDKDSDTRLFAVHKKFNTAQEKTESVLFDLDSLESEGTKKIFDIIGPIFLVLLRGGVLIVDELDAKLHPTLTQTIIRLYNNPGTNQNNAQLIFNTHDTNLLTYGQFRRDQIWFTEKDRYGATSLYSLIEYKEDDGNTKVRKDRSFEKDYIEGRYGAVPFINEITGLPSHGS